MEEELRMIFQRKNSYMDYKKIIDNYFKEAVKGLSTPVLKDKEAWYNYVINLPIHLQVVYTVIVFHQQVFNGGLHQYFFNPYGQFAFITADHLNLLKAHEQEDVLRRAILLVNADGFSIKEFRERIYNRTLEKIVNFDEMLNVSLDLLDTEYYELNENLEQLLVDYLKTTCSQLNN